MQWLDWLICFTYLAALTGIGIYFSRRQSTLDEFIKGGRSVGWLAVGFSLMAALNSGTDYIQTPAVVYAFGMVYVALVLTWIPLYFWVTRVTLPFYQRLDVYSAYEYLERRFGLGVRLVAALTFVLWRVGWMGVALYVPCAAVKGTTGNYFDVTWMVIILGVVVTLYTMLGGVKAVIWTDVIQFGVMFCGLFATLAFAVSRVPGGIAHIFEFAGQHGRLHFSATIPHWDDADLLGKIHLYFGTEVTFVGIIACILIGRLAAFTSDQIAIQRFQTTRNYSQARNAFLVNALSDVVWMFALGAVGLALFAYYQGGESFPKELQNDKILPYFMSQTFPVGLTGLVIAAIVAASLSSVDSALNSTTSIIMVDFYNRLWLNRTRLADNTLPSEQQRQILVSRVVNATLGAIVILVAANIDQMGEIYTVVNKILGAFFGALLGTFVLGMFSNRARGGGVMVGALAGLITSCFLSFFSGLTGLHGVFQNLFGEKFVDFCSHISWQWPPIFGIIVTLLVGFIASHLLPRTSSHEEPLTYWQVMRMKVPS